MESANSCPLPILEEWRIDPPDPDAENILLFDPERTDDAVNSTDAFMETFGSRWPQ